MPRSGAELHKVPYGTGMASFEESKTPSTSQVSDAQRDTARKWTRYTLTYEPATDTPSLCVASIGNAQPVNDNVVGDPAEAEMPPAPPTAQKAEVPAFSCVLGWRP